MEKGQLAKPLIIQNRTRARSDKLAASLGDNKVIVVDTVEEAVKKADIVFTCVGQSISSKNTRRPLNHYRLGDDAAIQETFRAATSVDVSGKLFVECRSVQRFGLCVA